MTAQPYAEVRETHSATVVMLGDRAYKLKKPVDLGFLDFSTPARRQEACEQEVALNKRMAPDVYLGVGTLQQPDLPDEAVVVMRRMPDDRRLSTLVSAGVCVDAELRELARDLAVFHAGAPRHPALERQAGRDAIRGRWRDSIDQVRTLGAVGPERIDHLCDLVERFLAGREALLEQRIRDGCVLDGHGDLQADDVFCVPEGPRALDCLEFDEALRHVDQLDDAAFLAMDLERLGAPDLAARFLDAYVEFSGDRAPASLRHHYIAYRAFVRAKVACVRVAQGDDDARLLAMDLTDLAIRHLALGDVRLILVGGLPGTGKSTLAGLLADERGYVLLSSDRIRKELAGIAPKTAAPAAYGTGLYSPASTDATYSELCRRAEVLLALGESVVLDASWTDEGRREPLRALARSAHATLHEVRCYAPVRLTEQRMRTRAPGASDADAVVAARLAGDESGWPSATVIETTGTPQQSLSDTCDLLDLAPPIASRG
ncbi:MAG: gluconate kinase [Nocardioides sp.]|nr:gluconate kinase [Nocardioides sp.]